MCQHYFIKCSSAILLILFVSNPVFGEMFTALADLESLVPTGMELARHLDNYIKNEEMRLAGLRGFLSDYETMHQEASADVSKYLANPINAYLLVKRLTSDWKKVERLLSKNTGSELVQNITQHRNVLRFPSEEDLNGAAVALIRLQDTYLLDTHALAEGKLSGNKESQQLTAEDCWELGRQAYNKHDHYHAILWMKEALIQYQNEPEKTVSLSEIFDYLAFSTYKQGNLKDASLLNDEWIKIDPHNKRALDNKIHYERLLREANQKEEVNGNNINNTVMGEPVYKQALVDLTQQNPKSPMKHERLCRGEKLMDPEIESRLRCRYVTNNIPFMFIQPIKMEEAYLDPLIVVYHDVINDNEIETIKKLAQPKFRRATTRNPKTGESQSVDYRICKSAWLKDLEHHQISKVSHRVGDITGLDMDTSEDLQVANYGIGGHYDPHLDYIRENETPNFHDLEWGNRIATWMFYMSDVEAGGATVFPEINVTVWPKKKSAAFWYNLHSNGKGNELTRHAACPVLTGSKWVSNKWIRERKQEFRRPCGLQMDK